MWDSCESPPTPGWRSLSHPDPSLQPRDRSLWVATAGAFASARAPQGHRNKERRAGQAMEIGRLGDAAPEKTTPYSARQGTGSQLLRRGARCSPPNSRPQPPRKQNENSIRKETPRRIPLASGTQRKKNWAEARREVKNANRNSRKTPHSDPLFLQRQ